MLQLKRFTAADGEQAYAFRKPSPRRKRLYESLPRLSERSVFNAGAAADSGAREGKMLKENHVPETWFFLWDDDQMVGLFRIRHYLTEALAQGAGHVGYGIHPAYRGQGYATRGLALAVKEATKLIREEEVYLSCHKDNPASLRVQLKNQARIDHEDDVEFYTRIPLPERNG